MIWEHRWTQLGVLNVYFDRRLANCENHAPRGLTHNVARTSSSITSFVCEVWSDRRCRGVSIEPNPAAIQLFNEYRREDVNLNIGISNEGGKADFFMMEDNTLSTFSEPERDKMVSHGQRVAGVTKVEMMSVPAVIEQFCRGSFPDFMSLDVEGMELPILRSIDFHKSCPKNICVEIADYSPIGARRRRTELADVLEDKGYYDYANTNLNAILVQNQFWFGPVGKK